MSKLKKLYEMLNDKEFCRYTENGEYYTYEENQIKKLNPLEMIEVGRMLPYKENLVIAYFKDEPTRVLYFCENLKLMKRTVNKLRIPNSWPNNVGEKVFYYFRYHLKSIDYEPVSLEQKIMPGVEHQFKHILKKLLKIYYMDSFSKN